MPYTAWTPPILKRRTKQMTNLQRLRQLTQRITELCDDLELEESIRILQNKKCPAPETTCTNPNKPQS